MNLILVGIDVSATIEEIMEQPEAIRSTLGELERMKDSLRSALRDTSEIVFLGCGSSHNLGLLGASVLRNYDVSACAVPAGEVLLSPKSLPFSSPSTFVATSRSGETTETVESSEEVKEKYPGSDLVGVFCYENSALSKIADISVLVPESEEKSVVQTKSFSTRLVAFEYLARLASGEDEPLSDFDGLVEDSREVLEKSERPMKEIGKANEFDKFIFLGTGEHYGLAAESMLKMEEMALSWSKAYSPLEFRHGPKSVVDEDTLVTLFAPGREKDRIGKLAREVRSLDASLLVIGNRKYFSDLEADFEVEIPSRKEFTDLSLFTEPIQLLGYYRGISLGLDPDNPKNLDYMVNL